MVPAPAAHGRRESAGREVEKPQVTGLFGRRPPTEGGGSCAQNMVRAERNVRVVSLDERDHALLLSLLEHKVLSTHQIKSLFFRSFRRCQHRMEFSNSIAIERPSHDVFEVVADLENVPNGNTR